MKPFQLATLVTLCLPMLPIATFAATPTTTSALSQAQLFSKGDEYSDVKISPTGKYLSAITSVEGKNVLLVLDTQTKNSSMRYAFPVMLKSATMNGPIVSDWYWQKNI